MKTIQRVFVSGLGAIGSMYAAKLHKAGSDLVTVIADRQRIDRYRQNGVTVNEKGYSFRFMTPETRSGPADLILIAVKQHHLAQSIKDIRNFVGEDTIILSLLNGITSEEIIGAEYGKDKLLLSFVVGTDAVREETHTRYTSIGKIVFGEERNSAYSSKVLAVKELFERAGIPYQIPENMLKELWWKFLMNVGVNQTSAILRAPYGVYQRSKEARELLALVSGEVLPLAKKAGISLDEDDIQKYIEVIKSLSPGGKSSMLQDVEAGRKTEVEIFAGTVVELGRKYGVNTPVNDCLLRIIRILEETYIPADANS